jgi:acetylornithine deacetylase/succinyl-diaminopimelate desuccinylase-like protein
VVDRRTLPGETDQGVLREMAALLRKNHLQAAISDTKVAPAPALETDSNLPLVRQLFATVGQTRPVGVDYFCDAAVLAAGGIPSVAFGPGDIAQAHTADEWISRTQLERGKNLLLKFLKSLS